jgi:16S rRNA (uracil1498-N3)-methyltransferase
MSRRRFYASPDNITDLGVTLSSEETHHLTHVLRMTPGDQAFVFDGCDHEYRCTFRGIKDNRAHLDLAESLSDVVESPLQLILAQSLVKGEKFDFIIQKATELGVSRISPLITRYAEAKIEEQQIERRLERWRRISLEALKQCGRRRLVDISAPRTLTQFIADVPGTALLLLSERGGVTLTKILEGITNSRSIAALVGPEGGWSDHELELLTASGATPITLGRRVLRTETAALAAIALIQHMKGDLSVEGIE